MNHDNPIPDFVRNQTPEETPQVKAPFWRCVIAGAFGGAMVIAFLMLMLHISA